MTSIAAVLNALLLMSKLEASEWIEILSGTEKQLVYASRWNVAWYVLYRHAK